MSWHPEILARRQQRVLAELGPCLTKRGFYLAGGTAVALHLGHRRSIDLDWFTEEKLIDPLRLAQELREQEVAFVTGQVAPGTLHGSVRSVRVSLLEYRYPLLASLRPWRGGSRIAARADLAAMKLAAVAQRGAKKDLWISTRSASGPVRCRRCCAGISKSTMSRILRTCRTAWRISTMPTGSACLECCGPRIGGP